MTSYRGSCLCGACGLTAEIGKAEAGICHCGMCRKWSGGMMVSIECERLEFDADAPIEIYRASEWGERVFCRQCGSSLAWRMQDGTHQVVSVQVFDDPGAFPVVSEIFIDEKPRSYALAGETAKLTGAQVFEMFAPKPEGGA
ncbi:GFA family protein [Paracoccus sp. (in: a-proteobacteria)]|uniref:GFA family protein n=1 Tax=Paracoccus sp. TaxID=267 RepID=UPI003A890051